MLKKAIHHFSRGTIKALEILGVLGLVVFLAWLGVIWRLSQGPYELNAWATQQLEEALQEQLPAFRFDIGFAQVVWGGRTEPFVFELKKVAIDRADNTPVLTVERLGVQLSKKNLIVGRLVPRSIAIKGPAVRVIRQEDGRFTLNVGEGEETPEAITPAAGASDKSREELVRGLLLKLQERTGLGLLDGLREVSVDNARAVYEDKVLNVSWVTRGADIVIRRSDTGLTSSAIASVDMGDAKRAAMRVTVAYSWETQVTSAAVQLVDFIPSRVAQQSEQLKELADIDMPVDLTLGFDLDQDFRPASLRFAVGGQPGAFNAGGLYETPVNIKEFFAKGSFDAAKKEVLVEELRLDLGGPRAEATARFTQGENGLKVGSISASLYDMPIDDLKTWWPQSLTPDPRWWVTEHLSKGVATKATLEAEGAYDPQAEKKFHLTKLGGKIDYQGIRVDYFPPLMPVLDGTGTANYDATSFNLDITHGKLGDMNVTKSTIHITDLDKIGNGGHSNIDIAVSLNGPLRTALKVLDSKPLEYPAMLGINSKDVQGQSDVDVTFKFPIQRHIALKDVKVTADAKLKDVVLPDLVNGMAVSGGPMDLEVSNSVLKVKGNGKLDGMPMTFDWLKNFDVKEPVSNKVTAKITLDAAALVRFGMPADMKPVGDMPAQVSYTVDHEKAAVLDIKGDLKGFGFSVPQAGYTKPQENAGDVSMTIRLKDGKAQRITGLDLASGGAIAKGDIDFSADGKEIQNLKFSRLVLDGNDIALDLQNKGKEGYVMKVTGRQIDASPAFKDNKAPGNDDVAAKPVTPFRVTLDVDRIITVKDKELREVRGTVVRNGWARLEQVTLDALAGGKPISLNYSPVAKGHNLRFDADDAGAALSALGLTNSILGGKLKISATPRVLGGPRDMVGAAALSDFTLKDAPVVAKLLNAISLIGVLQMLGGEGLSFKKARVDFIWTDEGQPKQRKNVRLLTLKNGSTAGASLGLTYEGTIDNWSNTYNLKGTLVPASEISKLLNVVPIIGTLLTAGGEGILAATYTIKGPKDAPTVFVNPLSVLAPGMLRKMFFEN
jgi:hypothetical protein